MSREIRKSSHFLSVGLTIAILLLLSVGVRGQETLAGGFSALMDRPPNVPADYVITPFGYFHPSCVQLLAESNVLLADGRVQQADGAVEAAHVCNYPHFTSGGIMIPADLRSTRINPLVISGWLESVSVTTSTSFNKIFAAWIVPPSPTANDGQLLYFFPGFEDISNVISILQPVLQWGFGYAGGGPYWTAASWNCCISGTTFHSPLINVNSGDALIGTIAPNCKPAQYCPTWTVTTIDRATNQKTTLAKTAADGQIWNWAFGAVSEDYGVVQCSDFPNNSGLTFTVHLYDQNRKLIPSPKWQGTKWIQNPNPNCNFGWTIRKTKETVKY